MLNEHEFHWSLAVLAKGHRFNMQLPFDNWSPESLLFKWNVPMCRIPSSFMKFSTLSISDLGPESQEKDHAFPPQHGMEFGAQLITQFSNCAELQCRTEKAWDNLCSNR